jgi:hypothetical protein
MSEEQTVVEESTDQTPLTQMFVKETGVLKRCTDQDLLQISTYLERRLRPEDDARYHDVTEVVGDKSVMDSLRDFLTSESKHAEETTMYGCQPEWLSDAKTHASRVRSALERWEAYNRNYVPRMPVTQTEIYASLVGFQNQMGGLGVEGEPAPGFYIATNADLSTGFDTMLYFKLDPITLKDRDSDEEFDIEPMVTRFCLDWFSPSTQYNVEVRTISGDTPHHDGYFHPNVNRQGGSSWPTICLGEGQVPFKSNIALGEIGEAFEIVRSVLHTNGWRSPYMTLYNIYNPEDPEDDLNPIYCQESGELLHEENDDGDIVNEVRDGRYVDYRSPSTGWEDGWYLNQYTCTQWQDCDSPVLEGDCWFSESIGRNAFYEFDLIMLRDQARHRPRWVLSGNEHIKIRINDGENDRLDMPWSVMCRELDDYSLAETKLIEAHDFVRTKLFDALVNHGVYIADGEFRRIRNKIVFNRSQSGEFVFDDIQDTDSAVVHAIGEFLDGFVIDPLTHHSVTFTFYEPDVDYTEIPFDILFWTMVARKAVELCQFGGTNAG